MFSHKTQDSSNLRITFNTAFLSSFVFHIFAYWVVGASMGWGGLGASSEKREKKELLCAAFRGASFGLRQAL